MSEDLHASALRFVAFGYSVVPTRTDGSKAPIGSWRQYMTHRADTNQVTEWLGRSNAYDGIGLVCGAVSGNLEMFELEGRAIAEGIGGELRDVAEASGLGDLWRRVTAGYCETTPSGGLHILYRVDGPVAGNTKLARRPATADELAANPDEKIKVLIETRGEGGYTIVAPSNGRTHPSNGKWILVAGGVESIATITTDERDALHALARSFDTTHTAAPAPAPKPGSAVGDGPDVAGDYNARTTWADLLQPRGWTQVYVAGGVTYWRRPGKKTGISATTGRNDGDNLYVFSTSTDFDAEKPYSRFAAYAHLEHGGDYSVAGKRLYANGYGQCPVDLFATKQAEQEGARPFVAGPTPQPPPRLPFAPRLPDSFYAARQSLLHIQAAARSRLVAPDALLGAILARVSLLTDYRIHLPALPRKGSLNIIVALCGQSGEGKGASMDVAGELLPARYVPCECGDVDHNGDHVKVPAGSGEGLVRNFFDVVVESTETPEGKKKQETKLKVDRRHVLISVDEGEVLASLANRQGQTTMQILRQSWSGEGLGFSYANKEKNLRIPEHQYRQSIVLGIQPTLAKALFDDTAGGTPQRFIWLGLADPDVPDAAPPWPGDLGPISMADIGRPWTQDQMDVAPEVVAEITAARRDKLAGRVVVDTLDAHRNLSRLKVAALLARLERRMDVTGEDWQLAGTVLDTSDAVREWVRSLIADDARQMGRVRSYARAMEAVTVEEHLAEHAVQRVARAVMRKLGDDWVAGAKLRGRLSSSSRSHFEDAVDALVAAGQIEARPADNGRGTTGVEYRRVGDHG